MLRAPRAPSAYLGWAMNEPSQKHDKYGEHPSAVATLQLDSHMMSPEAPPPESLPVATQPDLPPPAMTVAPVTPLGLGPAPSPPARTVVLPPPSPDATVRLSTEELHGFASTQAATPISLSALPAPPRRRTVQLSIEQLLALFRPPPKVAVSAPPPTTAPPVASRRARPRQLLLGGVAAALALGTLSYFGGHTLLVRNHRWVAPTVLSKTDPRVLQLAATLQQETGRKAELVIRKKELEARAVETTRWRELEAGFQASFLAALKNDLDGQRAELRRVQKLVAEREAAAASAGAPADHAELDARLAHVKQRMRMLEGALRGGRSTYEGLALRREYDRSVLEAGKAHELEETLARSLTDVDEQLKKKDTLLASIDASPYRLAIDGDVTLGFVPYENAAAAGRGEPLIACKTSLLFCDKVGEVGDGLAGEVRGIHPVTGAEVRGQLVKLTFAEGRSVPDSVLYAGQPPLSL